MSEFKFIDLASEYQFGGQYDKLETNLISDLNV